MKKLIVLLPLLLLFSCEGPAGPQGPTGPRGPEGETGPPGSGDGQEVVGQAFEVDANFDASNEYSQQFFFSDVPGGIEVLESDIVVVYWRFEVNQGTGNDVWQQLPVSYFFEDGGEMQYAFDHTLEDVQLFLQGDINLDTLGPDFTQDQIFRVAVLPVDDVQAKKIDLNNIDQVMGAVDKSKIQRIEL